MCYRATCKQIIIYLIFFIMKLKYITCSGANEYTDISELLNVFSAPLRVVAEFGIQVSGKKASLGSARYWWLQTLYLRQSHYCPRCNFALHLNQDWVEDFCDGTPSAELSEFLSWKNFWRKPFFGRVQLNFRIGREKTPDLKRLLASMRKYPDVRFILSYNDDNAEFIHRLYDEGFNFDLLYDNSHGEGIEANHYAPPAFDDVLQGYSGGISPENVVSVLNKISPSVSADKEIFIDAEGKLKGEDGHFSIKRCKAYVERAVLFV